MVCFAVALLAFVGCSCLLVCCSSQLCARGLLLVFVGFYRRVVGTVGRFVSAAALVASFGGRLVAGC